MSQPRASDQGTLTWLILTLPDSVRRRPTLFQSCCPMLSSGLEIGFVRTTYCKLNSWLLGKNEGEYVMLCPSIHAFENGQIRYHTTGIEVLESIKDKMISFICNVQIIISWVHSTYTPLASALCSLIEIAPTSNEIIILNNQLLNPMLLLLCTNDIRRRTPK